MTPPSRSPETQESWPALAISAAIVFASVLFGACGFDFAFGTNDDPLMQGIARGALGPDVGDSRLIFQSGWIGSLIASAFRFEPDVDWYSLCQFSLCVASCFTTTFLLVRRATNALAFASALAVGCLFYAPMLFHMQFTQTSLMCAAAAGVLLLHDWETSRWISAEKIGALGFAVMATLMRPVNWLVALALLSAASFYACLLTAGAGEWQRARRKLGVDLSFVVLFLLIASTLQAVEGPLFYSGAGWETFWRHHGSRAYVLENYPRWIAPARIARELERERGVTPEQYAVMQRWVPIDRELYSSESFAEMAEVIRQIDPRGGDSARRLARSAAGLGQWVRHQPIARDSLLFMLALALLYAFLYPARWRRVLGTLTVWTLFLVGILLAVRIAYRPPPFRVWMPLLAIAAICTTHSLALVGTRELGDRGETGADRLSHRVAAVVLCLCLLGPIPLQAHLREYAAKRVALRTLVCARDRATVEAFERIPASARIFVAPIVANAACYIRPFDFAFPKTLQERVTFFSWLNLTPWFRDTLYRDDSNLFDAICRDPANAFVAPEFAFDDVTAYLARHRPELRLLRYADDMPAIIHRCERRTARRG